MENRWSKEKAWEWYNGRPWLRGCNYMSADCANRVDQWQALGFEERMKTTEEELALMQATGFNTVRLIIEYMVWKEEHDSFLERFDRYLSLCAKYGISCMITLANDCMPPKGDGWCMPYVGEQTYDWGYHGGRKRSQHAISTGTNPHFYLDDPESREDYFCMVKEIVTLYRDDERICMWDVYNEPGNRQRDVLTMPNLKRMFETVRSCEPTQPLTAGVWRMRGDENEPLPEVEQYALDNSDIISYHCYKEYNEHVMIIKRLKKYGRPIINTEWLGRCLHNTVFDLFPLFYLEKIGCYNWGFVAGKYQTYEPWESTWQKYAADPSEDVDFTKWFHDLYRPNHRPYDPKEIDVIKRFSQEADKDFERDNKERGI
ncbi:MAG: cellulase family glycosylhydrolase [Clostridia bacterium]|nr:cellulase family glycosylhydrolase [Clostridia bacterium]